MKDLKAITALAAVLIGCLPAATASEVPPEELVRKLREARIALSLGDREKCAQTLQQAVSDHPKEILPVFALSAFYRETHAGAADLEKLRALLRKRLLDPEAIVPPASIRQVVEDPEVSQDEIRLMKQFVEIRIANAKDDIVLLDALARLQDRLGDREGARGTLGKIADLRPESQVLWQCVALDQAMGHWDSVVDLLRRIRARYGDSPWLRLQMVEALGKMGRYEEVQKEIELFDSEPLFRSWTVGPLLQAAWSLHDLRKDADAEKAFRKILEIDPKNIEARDAVLNFYADEQERASHSAALEESWKKQNDPFALQTEGVSRLAAGDAHGAYDLLKRSVEGLPDSEIAWFNFGLAALRLERWEEAGRPWRGRSQSSPSLRTRTSTSEPPFSSSVAAPKRSWS